MTSPETAGEDDDARAARIADLERQLFGRPGSATIRIDDTATENDRASALDELERLRHPRAASDATPMLDRADDPEQRLHPEQPIPPSGSAPVASSTPKRSARSLRILTVIGIAAVLAGTVVGTLSAPPAPGALGALDSPATTVERVRSAILRDAGLPLFEDGRIVASTSSAASLIAFRAPQGTADLLRDADASLVGNESSPFGGALYLLPAPTALDRADSRRAEVCAWVVERSFAIEGRCTPLDDFARDGLVFETERFGIRYAVDWSPTGEAELRALPVGVVDP